MLEKSYSANRRHPTGTGTFPSRAHCSTESKHISVIWVFKILNTFNTNTPFSPSHSEVSIPGGLLLETDTMSPLDQLRQRWENLNKDQSTKLQLSLNSLEQDQLSPVRMTYIVDLWFSLFINKCCLCLFIWMFWVVLNSSLKANVHSVGTFVSI